MEILTIAVFAVISVILIPVLIALCADTKDADNNEPKLTSLKKAKGSKRTSARSNNSSSRESKPEDKESVTVIANGTAVAAYEEMEGSQSTCTSPTKLAHAYEDPEALTNHPKQINDALANGGNKSPKTSIINETSPSSSMRSSRTSGGQPRVVSQDRALPEIPNQTNRLSVNTERSPTTKRALPQIPSTSAATTSTSVTTPTTLAVDDEAANHYDQLERDLPPHQIRSKSSESSSVKAKTKFALDDGAAFGSTEMIEPDEVTRSSVFVSTNPHEVYSSVGEEPPKSPTKPSGSSSEDGSSAPHSQDSTKIKVKTQYTKVKKESASDKDGGAGHSSQEGTSEEPVYSEAPPVPTKNYDAEEEQLAAQGDQGAAGGVALVIDNNAQDSGSGYYAVTDEGPAPAAASVQHPNLPESYDILTARASLASVRARQSRADTEEDYYETMDEKGDEGEGAATSNPTDKMYGGTELYAEIDTPQLPSTSSRPAHTAASIAREELYAEIDSPQSNSGKSASNGASAAPSTVSNIPDPGYDMVVFNNAKGEQTDSAGYAIVKEANAGATAASQLANDDEEDYAELGEPASSSTGAAAAPAHVNESLSRRTSDLSDYATVTFNPSEEQSQPTQQPAQPPPVHNNPPWQTRSRPRREHTYQEIDEVRDEKNPPDKKS